MFCKNCGKKIEQGATFCKYCGTKLKGNGTKLKENKTEITGTETKLKETEITPSNNTNVANEIDVNKISGIWKGIPVIWKIVVIVVIIVLIVIVVKCPYLLQSFLTIFMMRKGIR